MEPAYRGGGHLALVIDANQSTPRAALAAGPSSRPVRTAIWRARPAGGLPEPGGGEGPASPAPAVQQTVFVSIDFAEY